MSLIIFTADVDDMWDITHVVRRDDNTLVDIVDAMVDIEDGDHRLVHIEDDTPVDYIVHITPVHHIDDVTHQYDKDDNTHVDNFVFVPLLVLSQEIINFFGIAVLNNVLYLSSPPFPFELSAQSLSSVDHTSYHVLFHPWSSKTRRVFRASLHCCLVPYACPILVALGCDHSIRNVANDIFSRQGGFSFLTLFDLCHLIFHFSPCHSTSNVFLVVGSLDRITVTSPRTATSTATSLHVPSV